MRDPNSEHSFVKQLSQHMSVGDRRTHELLRKETSRMWRNFWIKLAHKHGYSNVQIAKEFDLTESSIRSILSKEKR